MKRYVQLKCSICKRSRDELIDITHYATDRCTITLGCEGRLSPIGYTNEGANAVSIAPTGLTNWYPRGSTVTSTAALQSDVLYNTSTGSKQQLVLAVFKTPSDNSYRPDDLGSVTLNFVSELQSARDYRQYTYRRVGAVQIINGVEDGAAKKVLRYSLTASTPDEVEVYVNGVKRNRGTGDDEYQLFDANTSVAPPNSVYFNTLVTGNSTQIDIIVTKAATMSTAAITFHRALDDESRIGTGAWEGVDSVAHLSDKYFLFYHDIADGSPLPLDVKLRLSSATASYFTDGVTPSAHMYPISDPNENVSSFVVQPKAFASLLLSREQLFTTLDRQRSNWVPLYNLTTDTGYLVIKLVSNVRNVFVTESAIAPIYPPLTVKRFHPQTLLKAGLTGNTEAAELDNALIVGPDS